MKFSTKTIETIEMTRDEEDALWNTPRNERTVCGRKVAHWFTDDGNNDILLDGETSYRAVIIAPWNFLLKNTPKNIFPIRSNPFHPIPNQTAFGLHGMNAFLL